MIKDAVFFANSYRYLKETKTKLVGLVLQVEDVELVDLVEQGDVGTFGTC